jgi:hypothetical protein
MVADQGNEADLFGPVNKSILLPLDFSNHVHMQIHPSSPSQVLII